jgi:uncharacterized glyoxalase superfamily protein PhnB
VTDPFEALREPVVPVAPDPAFAARLRERLTRAVLNEGEPVTSQTTQRAAAWPPALTPYIVVSDARAALAWYKEVFNATDRGEPHVNEDGTIGHMEVGLGDAVLMFAEQSDLWPEVPVRAPDNPQTFSHSLHLEVPNVDETVALARRHGAVIQREPANQPYGRGATIVDPFGHRWLVLTPPARATRTRHGDIVRVTMTTPNSEQTKDFYETVLGVPFTARQAAGAWGTAEINPPLNVWSPPDTGAEVQLCFHVDNMEEAITRVQAAGGTAENIERRDFGLLVECTDNQGTRFQLWQPPE